MKTWGRAMCELEDFKVNDLVLTPSGRLATIKKLLSGASKRDVFDRIVCQYAGGGAKDLVTLQPHQMQLLSQPLTHSARRLAAVRAAK